MPIPIPNLDDRNYDQLLKETESLIARYFPEYADIGPADPAVALTELFCYYFDIVSYQLNRVTPQTRHNFASLLGVPQEYGRPPEESVGLALSKLSRTSRAVTPGDIEALVLEASKDVCGAKVLRVHVQPGERVRVFILQADIVGNELYKKQQMALRKNDLQRLYDYLRQCSPICGSFSVEHTPFLPVEISAEVAKRRDSTIASNTLADTIQNKIAAFLDPLKGGAQGKGLEYGRPLTRGDIYELVEGIPGVDFVKSLYIKEYKTKSESQNFDRHNAVDLLAPPEGGLIKLMSSTKGEERWVTILGQSTR